MDFWKLFWNKYKHFFPVFLYMIFYMAIFAYVENRHVSQMHLLSTRFDRMIPFCEFFIVPYLLWFFYVAAGVIGFGFMEQEREQFYQLITNLSIGMTLFLIISLLWPNGHTLRPYIFPRDNVFTHMVLALYRTDTSTNILPSIHVFNSIAIHTAVVCSPTLQKHRWLTRTSLVLCVSIVLSTMFLKQHSVIDVVSAMALSLGTYHLVYQPRTAMSRETSRYRKKHSF